MKPPKNARPWARFGHWRGSGGEIAITRWAAGANEADVFFSSFRAG